MTSSKRIKTSPFLNEHEEIGVKTVQKRTYEETQIEWRIENFSSIINKRGISTNRSSMFFINDQPWFLKLWPNYLFRREQTALFLSTDQRRNYTLEYNFGLKKLDGTVENLNNGIMEGHKCLSDDYVMKLSEILPGRFDLVSHDVLTIICTLKQDITHSTQPTISEKSTPLNLINLDKLSENFKDLFGDKESCDVILRVMDKEYKAHRSVLIARSRVFAATFRYDSLEIQTGLITITDCNPDSFPEFLEYLYCGKLEKISFPSALDLYYTSDKYDVQELKTFCVEYLMQCLTVENICEAVVFADKYDELPLLCAVQEFFNRNAFHVFETSEWEQLMKNETHLANKLLKEMPKVVIK